MRTLEQKIDTEKVKIIVDKLKGVHNSWKA